MKSSSRRSFLACSAMAAAAAIPRFYVQTSDKSGQRLPVVGSGVHTYECVHDWLTPPDGLVWGDTHGLAQDEQGRIYVAHTVNKSSMRGESVVIYDADGRFLSAFGEEFRGGAHGLSLRREGDGEFLYHCDINRCKIVKTTLDGKTVWSHGYPREDAAYAEHPIDFVPTNVAFAPNGDFYVGDGYGSHHVLRFSLSGRFLGLTSPSTSTHSTRQTPASTCRRSSPAFGATVILAWLRWSASSRTSIPAPSILYDRSGRLG